MWFFVLQPVERGSRCGWRLFETRMATVTSETREETMRQNSADPIKSGRHISELNHRILGWLSQNSMLETRVCGCDITEIWQHAVSSVTFSLISFNSSFVSWKVTNVSVSSIQRCRTTSSISSKLYKNRTRRS